MIIGNTFCVYKCPECGTFVKHVTILSGNTFGATLFSDGIRIAPMLLEFPDIVKCGNCKAFYWLNKENYVGEYAREKAKFVSFLSPKEWNEAINLNIYKNGDEELYFRIRLWWSFNDRIRKGKGSIFNDDNDRNIYESNCIRLLEMLNNDDINDEITIAELHRNLGNYAECDEILDTIKEKECSWIKDALKKECEKCNRYVIRLI